MNSDPESKTKKKRSAASKKGEAKTAKETRFTKLAPNTIEERQNVLLSFFIQADIDRIEQGAEDDREAPTNFMKSISVQKPGQGTPEKNLFFPSITTKVNPQ